MVLRAKTVTRLFWLSTGVTHYHFTPHSSTAVPSTVSTHGVYIHHGIRCWLSPFLGRASVLTVSNVACWVGWRIWYGPPMKEICYTWLIKECWETVYFWRDLFLDRLSCPRVTATCEGIAFRHGSRFRWAVFSMVYSGIQKVRSMEWSFFYVTSYIHGISWNTGWC